MRLSLEFAAAVVIIVVVVRLKYLLSEFLLALVDISIELVTVFANRELLVVVNGNVNFLAANRLILRVVELRNIGVSQGLFRRESLMRVEVEQALKKV